MDALEIEQCAKAAEWESPPAGELPKVGTGYLVVKRCFDFISSLCVSVVLLIPMVIVALIIMIKDFGSPLYVQERVGKDGSPLRIWKFRSMRKGADRLEDMLTPEQMEEYRREYKLEDDPRLLGYQKPGDGSKCFGAKLRSMSIDELPQILVNICILGNMSVVGPRPLLDEELKKYYTSEEQRLILSVKPGLTGMWQVNGRSECTYESGERQKMELAYVRDRSFGMDIRIILKTVLVVIGKVGAR